MRLFIGVIQPQTSAASSADLSPDPALESRPASVADLDGRMARHLALLAELGELAMQMARDVAKQSAEHMARAEIAAANDHGAAEVRPGEAPAAEVPTTEVPRAQAPAVQVARTTADLGLAFARVSRAARQTFALEKQLAAELDRRERGVAEEAKTRLEARLRDHEDRLDQTRSWHKLLSEAVGRAIDADTIRDQGPERRENLLGDLESLLAANVEGCFLKLDFEPQVREICKALGVTLADDFVFEPPDEDEDDDRIGRWDEVDEAPTTANDYKPTFWIGREERRKREARLKAAWSVPNSLEVVKPAWLDPNSPEWLKPANWPLAWQPVSPPRGGGP